VGAKLFVATGYGSVEADCRYMLGCGTNSRREGYKIGTPIGRKLNEIVRERGPRQVFQKSCGTLTSGCSQLPGVDQVRRPYFGVLEQSSCEQWLLSPADIQSGRNT
jgi:hypothetical protein